MLYPILGLLLFALVSGPAGYWLGERDANAACKQKIENIELQRRERTSQLVLIQQRASDRIAGKLEKEKNDAIARNSELSKKLSSALAEIRNLRVPPSVVSVHNSVATGWIAPPPAAEDSPGTSAGTASAKGPPEVYFDEYVETCDANLKRHSQCVAQVKGWQEFWREIKTNCEVRK